MTNFLGYDQFEPSSLKELQRILIIGPSNSGKNLLLMYLFSKVLIEKYPLIYVISVKRNWSQYINFVWYDRFVGLPEDGSHNQSIKFLIEKIKNISEKLEKRKQQEKITLIFDDVPVDGAYMEDFIKNCRHHKINLIILAQHPTQLTKPTRSQLSLVFFTKNISSDKIIESGERRKLLGELWNSIERNDTDDIIFPVYNKSDEKLTYIKIPNSFQYVSLPNENSDDREFLSKPLFQFQIPPPTVLNYLKKKQVKNDNE